MKKDDSDKEILNQFYLIFTMFNWIYGAYSSNLVKLVAIIAFLSAILSYCFTSIFT